MCPMAQSVWQMETIHGPCGRVGYAFLTQLVLSTWMALWRIQTGGFGAIYPLWMGLTQSFIP